MTEAERRKRLAEALSPENMQVLCAEAEAARLKLLSRVYGGNEREVIDISITLENLMQLLQDFDDNRTEN